MASSSPRNKSSKSICSVDWIPKFQQKKQPLTPGSSLISNTFCRPQCRVALSKQFTFKTYMDFWPSCNSSTTFSRYCEIKRNNLVLSGPIHFPIIPELSEREEVEGSVWYAYHLWQIRHHFLRIIIMVVNMISSVLLIHYTIHEFLYLYHLQWDPSVFKPRHPAWGRIRHMLLTSGSHHKENLAWHRGAWLFLVDLTTLECDPCQYINHISLMASTLATLFQACYQVVPRSFARSPGSAENVKWSA